MARWLLGGLGMTVDSKAWNPRLRGLWLHLSRADQMSKFHGEQFWTTVKHHALTNWREINDDEFDALRAIGHDREVRERSMRERLRRERKLKPQDLDA